MLITKEVIVTVEASLAVAANLARVGEIEMIIGRDGVMMRQILTDLGVEDPTTVQMTLVRLTDGRIQVVQEILPGTFFTPGVNGTSVWLRHNDNGTNVQLPIDAGVTLRVIPKTAK